MTRIWVSRKEGIKGVKVEIYMQKKRASQALKKPEDITDNETLWLLSISF